MQQAAATSLDSDPIAILSSTESTNSMVSGMAVDDSICRFESHPDPTLPDLATIARTVVLHPDLLCNQSTPPDAVYLKVGINVVVSDLTDDLDEYTYVASGSVPNVVVPVTKTPSETGKENIKNEDTTKHCATDWDGTPHPGHVLNEKTHTERRLEEVESNQVVTLENYLGHSMEMTLAKLLTVGLVSIKPWPGSHWATYKDSINVQLYQGEPPTSAKYALAFGFDVKDFMDKISKDVGIDVHRPDKTKCKIDTDCKLFNDDRVCAIRTGHHSGYCIPTWWGICHAWSSAAILEQEPKCPVTYNNITFSPLELKGLLSYIYNDRTLSTVSAGVRFNGDDATDVKDEYGSSESLAFRDMNPGLVHIVLANIVGKLGKSVIMDVTAGSRVHNQPVHGFRVLEQTNLSLKEAAQTFYAREQYPWNANAKSIVYMKTRLTWVAETSDEGPLLSKGKADKYTEGYVLHYLLEMDGAGKIIGGEWLFDSKNQHPDFMYIPTSKLPADLVRPKGMRHADVSMLLEKSVACSDTQ